MKKLIVLAALILFSGITFSQTLQKGNLVGVHVWNINLKPDVTYNQMHEFVINKFIPEFEKHFSGKGYLTKCIRGENKFSYGMIWVYESENDRNKFYNDDGSRTELGTTGWEKVQPILEESFNTIGEFEYEYNDWLVQ